MARFVLLYHQYPSGYTRRVHWDFMLEVGNSLQTWAVAELPAEWHEAQTHTEDLHLDCAPTAKGNQVQAEQLGDHRREYLDYEGQVSGGRGHVVRIDCGTYIAESESPNVQKLTLAGRHVRGTVELRQTSPDSAMWILTCYPED